MLYKKRFGYIGDRSTFCIKVKWIMFSVKKYNLFLYKLHLQNLLTDKKFCGKIHNWI